MQNEETALNIDLERNLHIRDNDDEPDELSADIYGLGADRHDKKKPKKISLKLIMDRNLPRSLQEKINSEASSREDSADLKAKEVIKLTRIRLDREQIDEIDNLVEYLGNVTHLFLNNNLIPRIENLEFFTNLTFLMLNENRIKRVENLIKLTALKCLDLASNLIETVDVDELPKSLAFLNLRENPCLQNGLWEREDYENRIKTRLKRLVQLNGEDLVNLEEEEDRAESGEADNASSRMSGQLEAVDETHQIGSLQQDILERSKKRQQIDKLNIQVESQKRKEKMEALKKSISEKFASK